MSSASPAALQGLSTEEAERRLAEQGLNALPEARPVTLLERVWRQFLSPLIYILLFALLVDLAICAWVGMGGCRSRRSRSR